MSLSPQFLTDAEGTRTSVLLPIEEYEELLQDMADLATMAERRDDDRLSLEEVKLQLRSDGLL